MRSRSASVLGAVGALGALLLAFVAGAVTGHMHALPRGPEFSRAPSVPTRPEVRADVSAAISALQSLAAEPGRTSQDALHPAAPPSAETAEPHVEAPPDPFATVESLIARMSHRELVEAIAALTDLKDERLERVRDLRGYAHRLATIALQRRQILESEGPPTASPPTPEAMFAPRVDDLGLPSELWRSFGTDGQQRIYALFPSEGYDRDQVLVKWFREGDPQPLLFGVHAIVPGAPLSHVWMERRGGWQEGTYVVEFYDPTEPLEQIATGHYVVSRALDLRF